MNASLDCPLLVSIVFLVVPEAAESYLEEPQKLKNPVPPRRLGINQAGHIYIYIYHYLLIPQTNVALGVPAALKD